MTKFPLKSLTIPLVGLALGLSGCITSSGQYDKVVEVAPENSLLRFYGERIAVNFLAGRICRSVGIREYAGFKNSDVRLEMFYVTVAAEYTSVQYPYTLSEMVDMAPQRRQTEKLNQTVHLEAPIEEMYYKRYSLNGDNPVRASKPNGKSAGRWADAQAELSSVIFAKPCQSF